ncbi:MAG: M20/M25/M40 family metallo-hydrolase [Gelidibacter sp.]
MKYIVSAFALLLIVSCKSKILETSQENIQGTTKMTDTNESDVNFITSEELKETVSYLASDELEGRDTGSQGIEKAAVYLENKFKNYGVKPYFDSFRDSFKAKDKDAFNIIGVVEGTDPILKNEYILLGAHYDHIGFGKKVGNDSIANGANDDATGTSAVLAMSRYFAEKKTNKRSIIFALFSAEEMGLIGSKKLAEHLKTKNFNLYTMLEFEMIGVPMKDKDYVAYITGFDLSNMAQKINEYSNETLVGLLPKAQEYKLFYRSDNYSFFKVFNEPSQTISTFDFTNYDYYHAVGDEANKMDYDFMASLVNKLIPAVEKMSITSTREITMNE